MTNVFLDLDGTLVFEDALEQSYPQLVTLMELMSKHNFRFIINTARPYSTAKIYAQKLNIDEVVAENGAVWEEASDRRIYDYLGSFLDSFFRRQGVSAKKIPSKQFSSDAGLVEYYINPDRSRSATVYFATTGEYKDRLAASLQESTTSPASPLYNMNIKWIADKLMLQTRNNKFRAIRDGYPHDRNVLISDNEDLSDWQGDVVLGALGNSMPNIKEKALFATKKVGVKGVIELLLQLWNTTLNSREEVMQYGSNYYWFTWHPSEQTPNLPTQISGYVFDKNKLLIVRTKDHWTIPGGKPEVGETFVQTLHREVLEEAQVEITNTYYLGYASSRDLLSGQVSYQLRYRAQLKSIKSKTLSMETNATAWVNPENLSRYIPWAKGKVFRQELQTALNYC